MAKTNIASSSQSVIILERANKGLQTTVASAVKVMADLGALVSQSETLTQEIEDKNAQLSDLAARNDTAVREADAELRLSVKENREKVLNELLQEGQLAKVPATELASLQAQLAQALEKDQKELKEAVNSAVYKTHLESTQAAKLVEAQTQVEMATKDAQINNLNDKVAFLTAQVIQLQGQIDSDRTTRLEIAKAESGRQGVVIQQGKQ